MFKEFFQINIRIIQLLHTQCFFLSKEAAHPHHPHEFLHYKRNVENKNVGYEMTPNGSAPGPATLS